MSLVSVIIPNYNHAPFLKQRIDSVVNQSYQDFEMIILDDCSTDHSREIIETYRNHSKVSAIVYNDVNSGSTFKQWKKGMDLAKGEWIWIAESDDVADPEFLNSLLDKTISEDCGLRYSGSTLIDDQNVQQSNVLLPESVQLDNNEISGDAFIRQYMVKDNSIPNASAVVFRKKLVTDAIFQEISSLKLNGDWMFWISIATRTRVYYLPDALNHFRVHDQTVRKKEAKKALLEYLFIADRLHKLGYKKAVADRLRFIYHNRKLQNVEKRAILKQFLKHGSFAQLLQLSMKK